MKDTMDAVRLPDTDLHMGLLKKAGARIEFTTLEIETAHGIDLRKIAAAPDGVKMFDDSAVE